MALVRNNDEQVERYKTYVRSLNEQFARWIVQQWEAKSDKFWSHGMVDYLRHAVIIKRDHPDAAALLGAAPPSALHISPAPYAGYNSRGQGGDTAGDWMGHANKQATAVYMHTGLMKAT